MNQTERERLSSRTQKRYLWLRFKNGCISLKHKKLKIMPLAIFWAAVILTWHIGRGNFSLGEAEYLSPAIPALAKLVLPALFIGGTVLILILYGTPMGAGSFENAFLRIGLINKVGETPILISVRHGSRREKIGIYEFDGVGIPFVEWENKRQWIEAALNVHIVKLKEGQSKRRIVLHTVPAGRGLSDRIAWKDAYLIQDSSTLVLGRSISGTATVNLAKIPHILLGGSTGSGKSVLLKLLLMQATKKNMAVCIADFKGGVDFSAVWQRSCRMCFDEVSLLSLMDELIHELQRRKTIFRESGSPNIDEYNRKTGNHLQRYIFACDEVAELLDKTGMTKEQKETTMRAESRLAMIARQGRAFGIHLILATQRPDANILPGQIRNNMDCRVCGRADTVLSQIILDSTAAAEQIPKDTAGRFLLHDGTVFQAFWFDETKMQGE